MHLLVLLGRECVPAQAVLLGEGLRGAAVVHHPGAELLQRGGEVKFRVGCGALAVVAEPEALPGRSADDEAVVRRFGRRAFEAWSGQRRGGDVRQERRPLFRGGAHVRAHGVGYPGRERVQQVRVHLAGESQDQLAAILAVREHRVVLGKHHAVLWPAIEGAHRDPAVSRLGTGLVEGLAGHGRARPIGEYRLQ
ncbi:hypothetical protein AB0D98_19080 [Streptomyces sp. NPDC047987]|uniref:hypothetical protein n=1 Tax=unclassified Streptomyces TaxID=2593676 RepID=UPI003440577C